MKILITGNLGYVGPVVSNYLEKKIKKVKISGFDNGYFYKNILNKNKLKNVRQTIGDIRKIKSNYIKKFDTIIHLAAISNDPIGNNFKKVTNDINYKASVRLFKLAKNNSIKNFVFASSCSVYGKFGNKIKNEKDKTNPLTPYAKSKVIFENKIKQIGCGNTKVTFLRFSTACGMSAGLRLDLVLNDFVASALKKKIINIKSDGTPWRPLIDVEDMARAIHWSIIREEIKKSEPLIINVGHKNNNLKIIDIAKKVKKFFPTCVVSKNKKNNKDKRSYKVDFSLFKQLAPDHQPKITIEKSIKNLKKGLKKIKISNLDLMYKKFNRLENLQKLIRNKNLSKNLTW